MVLDSKFFFKLSVFILFFVFSIGLFLNGVEYFNTSYMLSLILISFIPYLLYKIYEHIKNITFFSYIINNIGIFFTIFLFLTSLSSYIFINNLIYLESKFFYFTIIFMSLLLFVLSSTIIIIIIGVLDFLKFIKNKRKTFLTQKEKEVSLKKEKEKIDYMKDDKNKTKEINKLNKQIQNLINTNKNHNDEINNKIKEKPDYNFFLLCAVLTVYFFSNIIYFKSNIFNIALTLDFNNKLICSEIKNGDIKTKIYNGDKYLNLREGYALILKLENKNYYNDRKYIPKIVNYDTLNLENKDGDGNYKLIKCLP